MYFSEFEELDHIGEHGMKPSQWDGPPLDDTKGGVATTDHNQSTSSTTKNSHSGSSDTERNEQKVPSHHKPGKHKDGHKYPNNVPRGNINEDLKNEFLFLSNQFRLDDP